MTGSGCARMTTLMLSFRIVFERSESVRNLKARSLTCVRDDRGEAQDDRGEAQDDGEWMVKY